MNRAKQGVVRRLVTPTEQALQPEARYLGGQEPLANAVVYLTEGGVEPSALISDPELERVVDRLRRVDLASAPAQRGDQLVE